MNRTLGAAWLAAAAVPLGGALFLLSCTQRSWYPEEKPPGPIVVATSEWPTHDKHDTTNLTPEEKRGKTLQEVQGVLQDALAMAEKSATFRFLEADGFPLKVGPVTRMGALSRTEDVFLELVYLNDLKMLLGKDVPRFTRQFGPRPPGDYSREFNAKLKERILAAEGKVKMNTPRPVLKVGAGTSYSDGYTQWYLLLAYATRDVEGDWVNDGPARKLLDEVIQHTAGWGTPAAMGFQDRKRLDGSLACAALYVTLFLFENPKLANGAVGRALGTPEDIKPIDVIRAMRDGDVPPVVALLRNICGGVETIRPNLRRHDIETKAVTDPDRGLWYMTDRGNVGTPRRPSERFVGGTAMYYMAKAWLTRLTEPDSEPRQQEYWLAAARALWDGLDVLEKMPPEVDSYSLTYLFRAATMFLRRGAFKEDPNATGHMAEKIKVTMTKLTADGGYVFNESYSLHYRPLAALQFVTQLQIAEKNLEATRPPVPKVAP